MAIQSRSLEQQRYEIDLERSCPMKIKLVQARPYNCTGGTCFINGRGSLSAFCPVCNGTGYIGAHITDDDSVPPFSDTYLIYGDVQVGHGILGAGGDNIRLLRDLGRENIGDATLFTKTYDHDRQTGKIVFPRIDESLIRPDRIIALNGNIYNVVREQDIEIGVVKIGRSFTLEQGVFTPQAQGSMR